MSCPKDCHEKKANKCCGISYIEIPVSLGDDSGDYAPENGAYFNTVVKYAANGAIYLYVNNGVYINIKKGAE